MPIEIKKPAAPQIFWKAQKLRFPKLPGLFGQPVLTREKGRALAGFLAMEAGAAALGILLAQSRFAGGVFASAAPLAIALAAAGGVRWLGMELLGITLGSLLFLPWPACVTAAAMAAIAGIANLAMRKYGLRGPLPVAAAAFSASLASGALTLLAQPSPGIMPWIFALCGAVLAGCCAYFLLLAQQGWRGEQRRHIGGKSRAALLLCGGMLLASLGGFSAGLFRPGHILGVLFVLAAAYCWKEAGGAIAGICTGAAMVMAEGGPAVAVAYALGGLLAGVFRGTWPAAQGHKDAPLTVPVAGGFALACVFFVALQGPLQRDPAPTVVFALEALGAILVFICIPAKLWARLRRALAAPEVLLPAEAEAQIRLSQAAGALRKVGEYVEEVAGGLEKLQAPLEQSVFTLAEEAVCGQCPEHAYCHGEHGPQMQAFYRQALKLLRWGGEFSREALADARRDVGILQPCRSPEALRESLARGYDIYAAHESRGQAEAQLRRAAAAQFGAVSEIMEEVAGQLARQKAFESEAAEAALRVLEDHGFRARSVSCVRGEENAARLTAAVCPEKEHSTGEAIALALGRATGIAFGPPEAEPLYGEEADGMASGIPAGMTLLTFAQCPRYRLETGAVQMSSSGSDYCGDYFDCFNDGRGREILVISDGMGTGGRAAVDSALATEIFSTLARCGLSFEGAVKIANQALLLKSCEETLATLDAAGINLYTGEAELCKAGGAASFLRRRGRAARVELSALPAGILRSIRPALHRTSLEAGDILVLVSDGMLCGPDVWLCEALEGWEEGSMQALAGHLAGLAVQMRAQEGDNQREDDLTVICGRMARA